MHLYHLLNIYGTDHSSIFCKASRLFHGCQPSYVERLVYRALGCTNKPVFRDLKLNFFKVAIYHQLKYEQAVAAKDFSKVTKCGKFRNPNPVNDAKQMERYRAWLLTNFGITDEEEDVAYKNIEDMLEIPSHHDFQPCKCHHYGSSGVPLQTAG